MRQVSRIVAAAIIIACISLMTVAVSATESEILAGNSLFKRFKWNQGDFSGPFWQNKTAADKKVILWAAVTQDKASQAWPSTIELAQIFLENMNLTITSQKDEMPMQGPFDLILRKKYVHSVGAIATGVFKPNQAAQKYTGGFKGSNNLIMRASLAAAPSATSMIPAMAIKFLRNKAVSGNMFCMYSLTGQEDFNFFKNNFTNHLPGLGPNADTALKALRAKFATASQWPEMTGLSKVAQYAEDGTRESKPVFPFVVKLVPSEAVHTRFPSQKTSQTIEQQLATIETGTVLYYVFGQAEPTSQFEQIGEIVLDKPFTSSKFGDVGLFFEHATVENDLQYRPDWKKFLPQ